MLVKQYLKTLGAAAALALMAGSVQASTCIAGFAGDDPAPGLTASLLCEGQIVGNDNLNDNGTNVNVNTYEDTGFFDISDWELTAKVERPFLSDGILSVTYDDSGNLSGTWSVENWDGFSDAMLVVMGGNRFIAYLIDMTAGTTGFWSTAGLTNQGQQQPAISHLSLYTSPAPIPLPAAGWLMLAGLGGLAALRRRKKAA